MKPLTRRKRRALERGPVTVTCLTCQWSTSDASWRPAKRLLAVHVSRFHRELTTEAIA